MTRFCALLTLCSLAAGGSAVPQDDDGQKNTALLKTYPKLEELVGEADAHAKAGRYAAALEIYGEACRTHPNHVVPVDERRSVGVRQFVLDRIAAWPKEGREAYRGAYDPVAREEFERVRRSPDPALLDDIVERFPFTSVVDDALVLRADLALDAGEPEVAVRALERVFAEGTDLPPAVVAARLGLAYSRAGRRGDLEALLRRAEREWPRERVLVNRDVRGIVEHLRGLLDETRSRPPASASMEIPSWGMIGGSPSCARAAEDGVSLGSAIWKAAVPLPVYESEEDERFRRYSPPGRGDGYRPLYPAVADGIAYVHSEYYAAAFSLFGSSSTPLWTFRLPQPNGVLMSDDRLIQATTAHDGRVFVNLITALGESEDQLGYVRVKFPFPKRALFALDAYTGRLLWKLGGRPRAESLEENATFAAPPTPEGDRLYVGAVKQRLSTDPFEHYLLCLDAATGRILWSTFVASGLTEINLFGNSTRESFGTPVSIAGDTLFYGTNHGVFAAIEKKTGRLRWTSRYAQLPIRPTRSIYVEKNLLQWVNSPPVVSAGVAVFTPTDSRFLHAVDVPTGRLLWRADREPAMRVLYGAKDDLLVLGGEELFFFEIRTGRLLGRFRPRSPGSGRGAVGTDAVYMPTRDGLATVRIDTRAEADFRRWPSTRSGGNIVVVDGAVLRAGTDLVEAFADRPTWERRVEEALKKNPDDPLLLYRCGVRLAQSERAAEAVALFERASARVEGSTRQDEERLARACRLRIFALRLELGREALRRRATADAKDHLTRAAQTAPDLPSRVEAVLLLSEALEAVQAFERAIREVYALLDSGDEVVGGERVAAIVRARVDEIVRRRGAEAWKPLEREAEAELERARRDGTPETLLSVSRRYPNAAAAETALLEAAQAFSRLGRAEDEAAALREFLREYPQSREAATAHVRLVLSLEKRGQFGAAAALLRRLLRAFPDATVFEGERRTTAREFAEERLSSERYRKTSSGSSGGTPLKLPLSLVLSHPTKASDVAPVRIGGVRPVSAADRVFIQAGGDLEALSASGRAWSLRVGAVLRFARFHEDSLLLATDTRILRVNVATGAGEWTYASATPMRGFGLVAGAICFFAADPRDASANGVAAVDAGRGILSWFRTFDGYSNSAVHDAGEIAVFLTASPARIYGFEAETGREVLRAPLASGGLGLQVLQANERHVLVASTDRFIESYELPSGKLRWRADLHGLSTRAMEAGAASVLLVAERAGVSGDVTVAALIDLKTGKYSKLAEGIALGDPRYAVLEEDRAFVVGFEGDRREVSVRELSLKDLSVGWKANLGEGGTTLLPPQGTPGHLVTAVLDRGENGKFAWSATVLDRTGKSVQNIRSEFRYERPPILLAAGGALVVVVESMVEVYR